MCRETNVTTIRCMRGTCEASNSDPLKLFQGVATNGSFPRRSMRRGHLLGEVTPSLVRHACVDDIAVDHGLVEQLVSDLAEREWPGQSDPRSVELAVDIVQSAVAGEGNVMGRACGD